MASVVTGQAGQKELDAFVTNGYGEFVISRSESDLQGKGKITLELYLKVYRIFQKHQATALCKTPLAYQNRDGAIQREVAALDPSLRVTFIPRTLYELIFLRKAIEEEVKMGVPCMSKRDHAAVENSAKDAPKDKLANCKWHRCCFCHSGDPEDDKLQRMAFRLNQVIVRRLTLGKNAALTLRAIQSAVDRELGFFKQHVVQFAKKKTDYFKVKTDPGFWNTTVAQSFLIDDIGGHVDLLSIHTDEHRAIVRNAVMLECSKVAQTTLLLYRGGEPKKDHPVLEEGEAKAKKAYSLSFGTGLFAGAVYDSGATPFHYIRQPQRDGYVVPIPLEKVSAAIQQERSSSLSYVPENTNALCQLLAHGEHFHARTRIWRDAMWPPEGVCDARGGVFLKSIVYSQNSCSDIVAKFAPFSASKQFLKPKIPTQK